MQSDSRNLKKTTTRRARTNREQICLDKEKTLASHLSPTEIDAVTDARAMLDRQTIDDAERTEALATLWFMDDSFVARIGDSLSRLADPSLSAGDFLAHYTYVHRRLLPWDTIGHTRLNRLRDARFADEGAF